MYHLCYTGLVLYIYPDEIIGCRKVIIHDVPKAPMIIRLEHNGSLDLDSIEIIKIYSDYSKCHRDLRKLRRKGGQYLYVIPNGWV